MTHSKCSTKASSYFFTSSPCLAARTQPGPGRSGPLQRRREIWSPAEAPVVVLTYKASAKY